MLVTLPTPDPAPKSDTKNPAHNEPGGLCEDPIAIRLRLGARAAQSCAGASPSNRAWDACISVRSRCRYERAGSACRKGLRAGMSSGWLSGPGRSSAPQMMAPTAKMPAHHQNTVV